MAAAAHHGLISKVQPATPGEPGATEPQPSPDLTRITTHLFIHSHGSSRAYPGPHGTRLRRRRATALFLPCLIHKARDSCGQTEASANVRPYILNTRLSAAIEWLSSRLQTGYQVLPARCVAFYPQHSTAAPNVLVPRTAANLPDHLWRCLSTADVTKQVLADMPPSVAAKPAHQFMRDVPNNRRSRHPASGYSPWTSLCISLWGNRGWLSPQLPACSAR